jgi:hypothetical protein
MCAVRLGHAAEKEYVLKLTGDMEKFTERRNLCDHFRGEALSDEELSSLKAKYENNKKVMKVLEKYKEKIEAGN